MSWHFLVRKHNTVSWNSFIDSVDNTLRRVFPNKTIPPLALYNELGTERAEVSSLVNELGVETLYSRLLLGNIMEIGVNYDTTIDVAKCDRFSISLGGVNVDEGTPKVVLAVVAAVALAKLANGEIYDDGVISDADWVGPHELMQALQFGRGRQHLEAARRLLPDKNAAPGISN